jgi:hypothetical protein
MGTAQGYQQILRSYAPMTDPIVPEPTPTPAAPAYAPAPAATVGGKRTFALVSFILGIVGFVFALLVPIIGLLAGIAAVVLGFIARAKEPSAPRWMWILGLVLGFLAILGAIISIIVVAIAVGAALTSN